MFKSSWTNFMDIIQNIKLSFLFSIFKTLECSVGLLLVNLISTKVFDFYNSLDLPFPTYIYK